MVYGSPLIRKSDWVTIGPILEVEQITYTLLTLIVFGKVESCAVLTYLLVKSLFFIETKAASNRDICFIKTLFSQRQY